MTHPGPGAGRSGDSWLSGMPRQEPGGWLGRQGSSARKLSLAVLVFGSANSYLVSLAPASGVRGTSKILHLVSGFTLALPPLTGRQFGASTWQPERPPGS